MEAEDRISDEWVLHPEGSKGGEGSSNQINLKVLQYL